MERETFIFYRSFRDAFNALDKDVRLRMYEAVINYGLDLVEPHFEGIEKVLWTLIRPQLEANNKRFENGCKGGNPNFKKGQPNPYYLKGEKNKKDNQKITKKQPKDNQKITERLPNNNNNNNNNNNENNNENINTKEINSFGSTSPNAKIDSQEPKIDFLRILDAWNTALAEQHSMIPRIRGIKSTRRKHISARCREYGEEVFFEMIRKAVASDFLNGKNQRGWIATIDWCVLPTNFQKIIDGNYDNKKMQIFRPTTLRAERREQHQQRDAERAAHDAEVDDFRALLRRYGISAQEYLQIKDLFDGNHTDEEIRREIQNKRV